MGETKKLFKFEIGDIVKHKGVNFLAQRMSLLESESDGALKFADRESRLRRQCAAMMVVERVLQECYDGRQIFYHCRLLGDCAVGLVNNSTCLVSISEPELEPLK